MFIICCSVCQCHACAIIQWNQLKRIFYTWHRNRFSYDIYLRSTSVHLIPPEKLQTKDRKKYVCIERNLLWCFFFRFHRFTFHLLSFHAANPTVIRRLYTYWCQLNARDVYLRLFFSFAIFQWLFTKIIASRTFFAII